MLTTTLATQDCSQLQRQLDLMEVDLSVNKEEGDAVIRMNDQIIRQLKAENTTLRQQATAMARSFSLNANPERVQREIYSLAREVDNLGHKRKRLEKQLALIREKEPQFTDAFLDSITPTGRSLKKETEYISCVQKGCMRRNPNTVDLTSSDVFRTLEKRRDEVELKYRDARALNDLYTKLRRQLQEQSVLYDKQIRQCKTVLSNNEDACRRMSIIAEEAVLSSFDMDNTLQTEKMNATMKKADNQQKLEERREQVRVAMASAMPRSPTTARPSAEPADDTTIITMEEETIEAYCKRMFLTRICTETGLTKIDRFAEAAKQQQVENQRLDALSHTLSEKDDATKKAITAILQVLTDTEYMLDSHTSVLHGNVSKLRDSIDAAKHEFAQTKDKAKSVDSLINAINTGLQTLLDKLLLVKAPPLSELQTKKGFEDLFSDMPDNIKDIIAYYGSEAGNADAALLLENEFQQIVSMALVIVSKLITLKEFRIRAGSSSCAASVNNSSILETQGLPMLPLNSQLVADQGAEPAEGGLYKTEEKGAESAEEYFNQILGKADAQPEEPAVPAEVEASPVNRVEAPVLVRAAPTGRTLLSITKADIFGKTTDKKLTMDTLGDDALFDSDEDDYNYNAVVQDDCTSDNMKIDLPWDRPASKAPIPSRTSAKISARNERIRRIPQVLREKDPMDRDVIKRASEAIVRMNMVAEEDKQEQ